MDAPVFLSVEQVRAIHQGMVTAFGGADALRDGGLLESAVMLPAAQFGGKFLHDGIPAMAGAYLFHLCRNHPFADGSKRTAIAAAEIFLMVNGYGLQASDDELYELTLGVAKGAVSKVEATAFMQGHATPSDPA